MGYESYLEYFIQKRERATASAASGGENSFRLTPEDCELLRDEAMIYYYRYDLMYMRKDYERVLRDTARNLLVFDFISHFAELVEDRESMEIYRPFALRLHFAARGLLSARKNRHEEGLRQLRSGIARIEALDDLDEPPPRAPPRTHPAALPAPAAPARSQESRRQGRLRVRRQNPRPTRRT
jgi:hypothetical protein